MCISMASKPQRTARRAAAAKASRTRAISSSVIARGVAQSAPNGTADGAMVCHGSGAAVPPSPLPSHGALAEPLRPACAIWMPILAVPMRWHVVDDVRERRLAGVGVEAEAAVADAATPLHVAHLRHHQPGAGIRQHAEMGHVPVGGDAVIGAVLAHRRDHDAVRKLEVGEPDRREQGAGHEI